MANKGPSSTAVLIELGKRLENEAVEATHPDAATCQELLDSISEVAEEPMTTTTLKAAGIGLRVRRAVKAFRRYKRREETWAGPLEKGDSLIQQWKEDCAVSIVAVTPKQTKESGLPTTIAAYRSRLVQHKKDLFKDPPVLPPVTGTLAKVETRNCGLPKRDAATGQLSFLPGAQSSEVLKSKYLKDFRPNKTPEEILRAGAFGGTYFRSIVSSVTNVKYSSSDVLKDTVDASWIAGLNQTTTLVSQSYNASINKFGVKCGGSLGMWESSGWISEVDPYGWFQWYCRFYQGRRCDDDERQISRWLKSAGPKGRFRSQLCNKILAAKTGADDPAVSPEIRQTLLHWGLEITEGVLERHRQRVGK